MTNKSEVLAGFDEFTFQAKFCDEIPENFPWHFFAEAVAKLSAKTFPKRAPNRIYKQTFLQTSFYPDRFITLTCLRLEGIQVGTKCQFYNIARPSGWSLVPSCLDYPLGVNISPGRKNIKKYKRYEEFSY
jgi:hypothetical protein